MRRKERKILEDLGLIYKPITNGDRIRAMTDEELAEWLVIVEQRVIEANPMLERATLYADWLKWVRQGATTES